MKISHSFWSDGQKELLGIHV